MLLHYALRLSSVSFNIFLCGEIKKKYYYISQQHPVIVFFEKIDRKVVDLRLTIVFFVGFTFCEQEYKLFTWHRDQFFHDSCFLVQIFMTPE